MLSHTTWQEVLNAFHQVQHLESQDDEKFDAYYTAVFELLSKKCQEGVIPPFTLRQDYTNTRVQITLRPPEGDPESRPYWTTNATSHASLSNSVWGNPMSYPEELHDVYVYVSYAIKVLDVPGQTDVEITDNALNHLDFSAMPDDIDQTYPVSHLSFTEDTEGFLIDWHNDPGHEKTVYIED